MNTHSPERMSAWHMLALVTGVLLPVGAIVVSVASGPVLAAVALLVAGVALMIVGASGLGHSIHSEAAATGDATLYPTRLDGQLDPQLTRWMWLVKWLLAIPHYVVLALLWVAFLVVTVVAGVMILFTGRYPVSLFEFAVGVLRWNWRVAFYANGVLGTDRYPPFTLARTDYPAAFDVAYPARLSNWQVLVKSWLLALPHLLMGINRWMYRTIAYAALMRDDYPPFRLDQGGLEPRAATS